MSDKQADNILSRQGGRFYDYLRDKDTSYLPGAIGAAIGAGGAAMSTERRRGEKPLDRAMRTIKNALLGGALGGIGGQLGAYGFANTSSAVGGKKLEFEPSTDRKVPVSDPDAKPPVAVDAPKSVYDRYVKPGWANMTSGLGIGAASYLGHARGGTTAELKRILGPGGFNGMPLLDSVKNVVTDASGAAKSWSGGAAPSSRGGKKWLFPDLRTNEFLPFVKGQIKNLQGASTGGADIITSVKSHLHSKAPSLTTKQLDAFISRHGIGVSGRPAAKRFGTWANQKVNPGAYRMGGYHPRGGSAANVLLSAGLGYLLPSLASAGWRSAVGGASPVESAVGSLTPELPSLGSYDKKQ